MPSEISPLLRLPLVAVLLDCFTSMALLTSTKNRACVSTLFSLKCMFSFKCKPSWLLLLLDRRRSRHGNACSLTGSFAGYSDISSVGSPASIPRSSHWELLTQHHCGLHVRLKVAAGTADYLAHTRAQQQQQQQTARTNREAYRMFAVRKFTKTRKLKTEYRKHAEGVDSWSDFPS